MSIEYHSYQLDWKNPAIKQLALSRLKIAADKYFVNSPLPQAYSIFTSYLTENCCQVAYVSNVAFIFSKYLNTPPLEIAKDFATFYAQTEVNRQDFTITAVTPGFLQLKLTDNKLVHWLQNLPFLSLILADFPLLGSANPLGDYDLFTVQYAHSRCYSLLQLAQREGLITLEEISASKIKSIFPNLIPAPQECSILIINHPQPLPWLGCNRQLQFCHPAEYALVIQLVKVVDELYGGTELNRDYWAKRALNLSQTFAEFYSHCRIFSEIKTQNLKLAQARLGLNLATYTVLKLLLQRLGVFAPQEL